VDRQRGQLVSTPTWIHWRRLERQMLIGGQELL
jgi:hypothetical protein